MRWWGNRSGHVYVIQGDHGAVKVGHSIAPPQRLGNLQTGSPFELRILHSLFIQSDAEAVEKSARQSLSRWLIRGEWFDVTPDVAIAAVYGAAARFGEIGTDDVDRRFERHPWPLSLAIAACYTPAWIALSLGGLPVGVPALALAMIGQAILLLRQRRNGQLKFLRSGASLLGGIALSIIAVAVGGAIVQKARAEDRPSLPSYDIGAYCTKVSALLGDNPVFKEGCASNENDAKAKLTKVWAEPPAETEVSCLKLMGVGSPNNYQALAGCVSMSVGGMWLKGGLKITPAAD